MKYLVAALFVVSLLILGLDVYVKGVEPPAAEPYVAGVLLVIRAHAELPDMVIVIDSNGKHRAIRWSDADKATRVEVVTAIKELPVDQAGFITYNCGTGT